MNSLQKTEITDIATVDLHFDPENPRFYRLSGDTSDEKVVEEMLDDEGVQDLMVSIGQQGYFPGEPLLVVNVHEKSIVVEGNRRLTAVKLLNGELSAPAKKRASVDLIIEEAANKPKLLPCLVFESREEIVRYLGFRHITGIREWDSLSKAKYLANIRETFYKDEDLESLLKKLAKDIGSRSDYVGTLLSALRLYEYAEERNYFDLNLEEKDITFSLITTAIGYSNISDWLGLVDKKDIVQDGLESENLKSLFAWMFVQDQQGNTILGESRELKTLAHIVGNEQAVDVLRKTSDMEQAYLYSDGPENALKNAMLDSEKALAIAWGLVPKVEIIQRDLSDLSEELFRTVKLIRNSIRDRLDDE